ncbi:thiamine-phosphate kinase [Lyngbya sp. CCY1209]|uniref:thiamine-phosphate kinase n=1 Tax=Lyngbya sp. CCY1209 TaxID=2886103 RepID=UPI002D2059AB|nr:thiamine-phosphate kinase [Lyngbya sp. CCY1209]MEB3886765.1 thiamine-phosphate kinase [Lyngbya sp. CCY1209]
MYVRDIGEQGLLKIVKKYCPPDVVGDDAAVVDCPADRALVVTTDMLVEGCHFSDRTTPPEAAGWRAVAANLSDLAAMGASPLGITAALGITGETPVAWVEGFYRGMADCLDRFRTPIVGGDLCRSPVNSVSITAFGAVSPDRVIRRTGAKPGWMIIATGVHGDSRGGLELLLNSDVGESLSEPERRSLIFAHQYPRPRLDVLPVLEKLWEADPNLIVAGMDSSDGLADAIVQVAQACGVGARIDTRHLPTSDALKKLVSSQQAMKWTLYGGEDFELVLFLPPAPGQQLVAELKAGAIVVGMTTAEPDIILTGEGESEIETPLTLSEGFQHF